MSRLRPYAHIAGVTYPLNCVPYDPFVGRSEEA